VIRNREDSVRKLVRKPGAMQELRFCYEAGPTGYVLYWQLTRMGAKCAVVAPTLLPVKAGDRVKRDRRDALKLARNYRAGESTAAWVPDVAPEAWRDVRAREAAKKDQLRARHRLNKFLLRHGRRPAMGVKPWTHSILSGPESGARQLPFGRIRFLPLLPQPRNSTIVAAQTESENN
jgi:transposase